MNKIEEGIKNLKGSIIEIPDTGRSNLPEFFKSRGFKMGVEVGVYKGKFMEEFARVGLEIHGVDPWEPFEDFDLSCQDPDRQQFLYEHAIDSMKPYNNATIVRKTSMDATEDYEDESIDFVYIDGSHYFKNVAEDLCGWTKKVKKGGIVSGHDYIKTARLSKDRWSHFHVKFVIDAYIEAFRIKRFYILGEAKEKEGEIRDKVRSWFFIKE